MIDVCEDTYLGHGQNRSTTICLFGPAILDPGTSAGRHVSSLGRRHTYVANIIWLLLEFCQLLWADDRHFGILNRKKDSETVFEGMRLSRNCDKDEGFYDYQALICT